MSTEVKQVFNAVTMSGKAYTVTEQEIIDDATRTAEEFKDAKECGTITYGMVSTYRDLSKLADDIWRGDDEGTAFEIWPATFEKKIEGYGFSLMGDDGDGTVTWLHVKDCDCFPEDEEEESSD